MKKLFKGLKGKAGKALGKVAEKAGELLLPIQPEPRRAPAFAPVRPRPMSPYVRY